MKRREKMKWIRMSVSGFCYGVTIGIGISLLFNYIFKIPVYTPASPEVIEQLGSKGAMLAVVFGSGTVGMVSVLLGLLYNQKKMPTLWTTGLHYLTLFAVLSLVGFVLSWYRRDQPVSLLIFWGLFTLIYAGIWFFRFFENRMAADELNNLLREKNG